MFPSTEVRWFIKGALPEKVSAWFEFFDPEPQDPRQDYYLNTRESVKYGIKLREENIQIKTQIADLGLFAVLQDIEGQMAKYEKWSFPVTSNEEWASLIERPDVWVPVKKMRQMIRFTLEGGFPDKIEMEERVENGCEVELSTLEVIDKAYWSLAFEAFGKTADVNLEKTLSHIFESRSCPLSLSKERSFGYAQLIYDLEDQ